MGKNLIIIDMQNDFITGSLGIPEAIEAEHYIVKNLNFEEYTRVFLTHDTHSQNYLETAEGKKLPIPHCIRNTYGWEISTPILKKLKNSKVPYYFCNKFTFGYKWSKMDAIIENDNSFTIVGVCTDICVISNALILKALYPEARIEVIGYMRAGTTPEKHDEALDIMKSCQIEVV